jgi:predicted phage tail protein
MGLTVDHIEIRYRPSDSAAAWTFVTVPAGQGSIQLKGVERGRSYQIEARSVAPSGAASAWVAQTHVVADATILPLAPTGLSATPVADGVALKWAVASTQRPDAEYEVWRTTDLAGAPDPAGWTQIQVVTALAWTDPITDGVLRWYRVRSHDFSGHTSAYSSNINSRGKTVADGADVSKNNVPLTLFNPKFEGGNVGWTSRAGCSLSSRTATHSREPGAQSSEATAP